MSDKARGYAHRIDINADAQQVWRALTLTEQLRLWCSPDAEIRARSGGLFRASVDSVTEFEAHIDVCEPGRRLKLIYLPMPGVPPADRAMSDDFILDAVPEGTIVRLLGAGFPVSPEWEMQFLRLRMSWSQALARLKVLVEKQLKQGVNP
jgi:uncharacterized protein YndB with AHSA1/START domain